MTWQTAQSLLEDISRAVATGGMPRDPTITNRDMYAMMLFISEDNPARSRPGGIAFVAVRCGPNPIRLIVFFQKAKLFPILES
jgi:hypothetical protein